jgi:NADPH2:quinone reductase
VPGNGVAGVVTAVGDGVDRGRTVAGHTGSQGGYAQLAAVPVERLVPVPDGVSLATAAAAVLAVGREVAPPDGSRAGVGPLRRAAHGRRVVI